jgi:rare lipoprotein A
MSLVPFPLMSTWRTLASCAVLGAGLLLAACSTPGPVPRGTGPTRTLPRGADGPPATPLGDAASVPDAEPKVEPIRQGGPNKPYTVLGQDYVPMTQDEPLVETGLASWYGRRFHGRKTASGETYNMLAMTAAHKTMPLPSYARVRNPANGREVIVRVNDRGPFAADRVIDLSYAAAVKLGVEGGVRPVEVERLTFDQIRAGVGRTGEILAANAAAAAAPAPAPVPPPVLPRPAPALTAAAPPPAAVTVAVPQPAAVVLALPPTAVSDARLPERGRAYTEAATGFWLQLGAFRQGAGAYSFQQKVAQDLGWLAPLLTVFAEGGLHRLQAGPWDTREQALDAAERVRSALQLVTVLVERR